MGFLDKAKKLAEQAQTKLDEVQKQVNTTGSSGTGQGGPAVEYDKHGRPIPQQPQEAAAPPHGDPLIGATTRPPPHRHGPASTRPRRPAPSFGDPPAVVGRRPAGRRG